MRIVVFTADPNLERTRWWITLQGIPELRAVMICRKVSSQSLPDILRRLRRNIAKHGILFVPMRAALLFTHLGRRLFTRGAVTEPVPPQVPTDLLEALDIHSADTLDAVRRWQPDLGVSIGAPILRSSLFGIPLRGTINLHLGKVPDYRGAPPAFWELWTGATEIGATIHWVDEGLDTGKVLAQGVAPIYSMDTLSRLEDRVSELGHQLFSRTLRLLIAGEEVSSQAQPGGGRTFRFPTLTQRARLASRLALRRWRRRLGLRTIAKTIAWLFALHVIRPVRDGIRTLRRAHPIRVFTFHRVTDLCRDGMTVSPAVFRKQIQYLKKHHEIVDLDRCLELAATGARLRRPLAVVSFDDGYQSVHDAAAPCMAELQTVGCCFVSTDLVATERRFAHDEHSVVRPFLGVMSWTDVQRLKRVGWAVGGHTASHPRLSECPTNQLERELAEPLRALKEHLGLESIAMAYPFGGVADITPAVRTMVRDRTYTACFSDFGGENHPPADLFDLRRIELGGDHDTLVWKSRCHGLDLSPWRSLWDRGTGQ